MPTALFTHLEIVRYDVNQLDLAGVVAHCKAAVVMDRHQKQRTENAQTVCGVCSL